MQLSLQKTGRDPVPDDLMNDALYIIHAVDLAQIGDQRAQMFCIIDADRQLRRSRDAIFIDFGIDLVELGLALSARCTRTP